MRIKLAILDKKIVIGILALCCLLSLLTGCSNKGQSGGKNPTCNLTELPNNDNNNDIVDISITIDTVKKAKETDVSLFEYTDVDGGISITGFNGSDEIVVVPEAINSKDVVLIGENAFVNNDTMKGIKIPSKVQSISMRSFANCTALEVFVSGSEVKKIDMYAFNGCKKLHAIELNDGLVTLGGLCFALTNLTEIEIPSSVTDINYPFTVNDDKHFITVIAESGSSAEQYVNEKGEEYHLIFQAK